MQLTVTQQAGSIIAAPVGRIDHASADSFLSALQDILAACGTGSPPVVIDCSGVDYIASVGLRALKIASVKAKDLGCRIGVAALQPLVQEVFNIACFNRVIACFDTVESAKLELSACK